MWTKTKILRESGTTLFCCSCRLGLLSRMCSSSVFMITISSSDTFTCQEFESLNYDFDDVVVNVLMLSLLKVSIAILVSGTYSNLLIFKDMDEAAAVSLTYSIYSILCKSYPRFPSPKCPDNHSLTGRPHIQKHRFQNKSSVG